MREYEVTGTFSTTVMRDGSFELVSFTEGDRVKVEDDLFGLIEHELPGYLRPAKTKKPQVKVETKAGPQGKTRQVVDTKKPAAKKKAGEG